MKKLQYIQPTVEFTETALAQMLAGSVTGNIDDETIGYGGVDEEGSLDPGTKEDKYDWDW